MRNVIYMVMLFLPFLTGFHHANVENKIVSKEDKILFQNIKVEGNSGNYHVSGRVKSKGPFFYSVEDGHYQYVEVHPFFLKQNGAFNIDIQIAEEKLPRNAVLILYLYERNNGRFIHSFPVVLERFK